MTITELNRPTLARLRTELDAQLSTITIDGKGEFINSVTYKDHTGCEPIFQENDQLVDKKHLEALNEWHNYSIFWDRTNLKQQEN